MSSLYETDFYGWTQTQAEALRRRSANEFDWDNLLDEIASLGRREANELRNRLSVLLMHLLKWDQQVSHRSPSWAATIREQRRQVLKHLDQNPSLKSVLSTAFEDAYETAIVGAVRETGLDEAVFRDAPRKTVEHALTVQVDGFDERRSNTLNTKG